MEGHKMSLVESANLLDGELKKILSSPLSGDDADALGNARDGLGHVIYALSLNANLDEVLPASEFVGQRLKERCENSSFAEELQSFVIDFCEKIKNGE
jgi:hypothetical protein